MFKLYYKLKYMNIHNEFIIQLYYFEMNIYMISVLNLKLSKFVEYYYIA